jgi:hypothetical protein
MFMGVVKRFCCINGQIIFIEITILYFIFLPSNGIGRVNIIMLLYIAVFLDSKNLTSAYYEIIIMCVYTWNLIKVVFIVNDKTNKNTYYRFS